MKRFFFFILLMTQYTYPTLYGVILAGGVGERLWPLSRQHKPKQFLTVGSSKTLLEQSVDRLKPMVDYTWVVTNQDHNQLVTACVGERVDHVLTEPVGRNTGPAIIYSCLQIAAHDPEAVVLFVPADPYIPESAYEQFQNSVLKAVAYAQAHDELVLLGVKPTYAATGYGYIEYARERMNNGIFGIERFHEKPSIVLAQNYSKKPTMLWNIGIFCGKVSCFIDQYKRWAPSLYEQARLFVSGGCEYADLQSISIDYAIMESSDRACVLPVDFSWCDVGNVDVFASLQGAGKQLAQQRIAIDAHNNVISVPDKMVALIGVHDLCVIETEDALLITKRNQAEKVRAVVKQLKEKKQVEYL